MRGLALLVVTAAVATNSGAQTPLTIDPDFRFYYTPEVMNYWDSVITYWQPKVGYVHLRQNGDLLVGGSQICPVGQIPWGYNRPVLLSSSGDALSFIDSGAPLHYELPQTNQYFGVNKRFNYDGSFDYAWNAPGPSSWGFQIVNLGPSAWHIFDDLSALDGGYFRIADDPLKYVLIKTTPQGARDSTFQMRHAEHPLGPYGDYIHPLSNGQLLFNGRWTHYEGRASGSMVRINTDGSQDTTFYFPSWQGTIAVIHEQEDGKVIMGGRIWMNDHADTLHLVRVNVDGSLDSTFNNFLDFRTVSGPSSSMNCGVNVLEKLDDGRFVVGGKFTTINGEPRGCIACVDTAGNLLDCWADGGLQPIGYTPGGGPYVMLYGFKCLANGECYIFGEYQGFTDSNGFHPEQVLMSRMYMPNVGIEERKGASRVYAYPNPGGDRIWFGGLEMDERVWGSVSNMYGVLVKQEEVRLASGMHVSDLPPGCYTIRLQTRTFNHSIKWVRQ